MTSSVGTWRPLMNDAVASSDGKLPLPVNVADSLSPPMSRHVLRLTNETQQGPLDLCTPRRSVSTQQPGWSTTHETTASNGKLSQEE